MSTRPDHPASFPPQHQDDHPGHEHDMTPRPEADDAGYKGSSKLKGKVALVTGGDSGIGRAVAVFYAKEGADVAIAYFDEDEDAEQTKQMVEAEGQQCLLLRGDLKQKAFCTEIVEKTVAHFGKLNILVNNAAVQYERKDLRGITEEQLDETFRTNIYSQFFVTQAALDHMGKGDCIINTTSVVAFRGHDSLMDYAATKGAILSFTRALSANLADKGIRVNGVAPGPIWTPFIPSTFDEDRVAEFGQDTPMGRAGQPEELAPAYVFLASDDASYISGQTIHVNGGEIVGA